MTDQERMKLLDEVQKAVNVVFNGSPDNDVPDKRVIWGMVAIEVPTGQASDEAMMTSNTQDVALLAALFFNASDALRRAIETINDGRKLDG